MRALVIAVTVIMLTGCASPAVRGDRSAGPGRETQSSPFELRRQCQSDCRGCTPEQREAFEAIRDVICPFSGGTW